MENLEKEYNEWLNKNKTVLKEMYEVYLQEISHEKMFNFEDWAWDYYESIWE